MREHMSSSEKLDSVFRLLSEFEYERELRANDSFVTNLAEVSHMLEDGVQTICATCNRLYGVECTRKRHFEYRDVECKQLKPNWHKLLLKSVSEELAELGFNPTEENGSFILDGVKVGVRAHVGVLYESDLHTESSKALRIGNLDALLVVSKTRHPNLDSIEGLFPEVVLCDLGKFSKKAFREEIFDILLRIGKANRALTAYSESGPVNEIARLQEQPWSNVEDQVVQLESVTNEILSRGKSSIRLGNELEDVVKEICSEVFFSYSISNRRNLPDILIFAPGSMRYYVTDVKSGRFLLEERRKALDYALTHRNLVLPDFRMEIAGLLLIGPRKDSDWVGEFCDKTRKLIGDTGSFPQDFTVSWLTIEGLSTIARCTSTNPSGKFLTNLYLGRVFDQGYCDADSIRLTLEEIGATRGEDDQADDLLYRALIDNRDRYHPTKTGS